jgi:hypothetical protein
MANYEHLAQQILNNGQNAEIAEQVGIAIWERIMETAFNLSDTEYEIAKECGFGHDELLVRSVHKLTAAIIELTQIVAVKL